MSEWKIKGAVDAEESKSAQEQEQAVLDTAVEKGEIAPESAGKNEDEVPVINLDEVNKAAEPVEKEKETVETEEKTSVISDYLMKKKYSRKITVLK